jgi:large subunit ribosomal protein L4
MELNVNNMKGEVVGKVAVDQDALLGKRVSSAVVHEVIRGYRANTRAGTASTKGRGAVSGGGHKPWKQKHTGNARAGSIRSPLWRKGGIIFGPHPRSYEQRLPASKRLAALRSALQSAFSGGNLRIVDSFKVQEPKTKVVAEALNKLGPEWPCLLVISPWDKTLWQAARNIPRLEVRDVKSLNAYDCLAARRILFTRDAFDALPGRLRVASLS